MDIELKESMIELKKLGDNPSKFYTEMQTTFSQTNSLEKFYLTKQLQDGLREEILQKTLLKVFIRVSPNYWGKMKSAAKTLLKKSNKDS